VTRTDHASLAVFSSGEHGATFDTGSSPSVTVGGVKDMFRFGSDSDGKSSGGGAHGGKGGDTKDNQSDGATSGGSPGTSKPAGGGGGGSHGGGKK
jgi:hypothetical protein